MLVKGTCCSCCINFSLYKETAFTLGTVSLASLHSMKGREQTLEDQWDPVMVPLVRNGKLEIYSQFNTAQSLCKLFLPHLCMHVFQELKNCCSSASQQLIKTLVNNIWVQDKKTLQRNTRHSTSFCSGFITSPLRTLL